MVDRAALVRAAVAGLCCALLPGCEREEPGSSGAQAAAASAATPARVVAPAASVEGAEPSARPAEDCCMSKNPCKGKGGCAVPESHACKGQNECRGRGGCRAHCPG